jgi:tetratricopeptide (TPR) repeat protein
MEWGHRRARQLLRRLRTPGIGRDEDQDAALLQATGAASLRDAVHRIADRALGGYPPLYATIVQRVDVEGRSCKIVMDELHLSERSFYRYRSAAIAAIEGELAKALRDALPADEPIDLDALALYAKGRYLARQRTQSSLARALGYFERALARDSQFALAHAGIAGVCALQAEHLIRPPAVAFADAHAALARALERDPTLPEAHAISADMHLFQSHDHGRARAALERALTAAPDCTAAHVVSAWLALLEGDGATARAHVRFALAHEPGALDLLTVLGIAECTEGETERGLTQLADVLELDPDFSFARFELVRILTGLGRFPAALAHLDRLQAQEPRPTYTLVLAYVEALAGEPGRAQEALRSHGAAHGFLAGSRYLQALLHLGLGDQVAALLHYRAAVEAMEPWTALLPVDGFLRPLQENQGFRELRAG